MSNNRANVDGGTDSFARGEDDTHSTPFEMGWETVVSAPNAAAAGGVRQRGPLVSITTGTALESTRKPLLPWFRLIRDFKRGCSKESLRRYGLSRIVHGDQLGMVLRRCLIEI